MALISNGILGAVSGKVSGVVGAKWKGLPTIRAYAKPSNPKTEAQTTQRSKFSFCIKFASELLTSVVKKFWVNKNENMSEFNSFNRVNIPLTDDVEGITTANKTTIGSLEIAPIEQYKYDPVSGEVAIIWTTTTQGNGSATDKILAVVWDKINKVAYVSDGNRTRADGDENLFLPIGMDESDLIGFLSVYKETSGNMLTSNSVAQVLTLAV